MARPTTKEGFIDITEVAQLLGVTATTVKNYEAQGLPINHRDEGSRGKRWFLESDVLKWQQQKNQSLDLLEQAELRKKTAEAVLAEYKVAKYRGELVPIKLVINMVGKELSTVRAKLLSLSSTIAPNIYIDDINEREKIIDEAIDQILQELTLDHHNELDWTTVINPTEDE